MMTTYFSRFRPATYLLLVLLTATIARADEPVGIKFFTGTWKELLAEAKKQNKPIFVDIYTTWCGPCKKMAKEAFPDKAVGELFNASFVSYQIDAEKGEGLDVAKQYAITAYPTSLFVSADGGLIQRTVGYTDVKGLMAEASMAVEAAKDPKPIGMWDKEFVDGKRDAQFLSSYLAKRAKLQMPNAEALEAYLTAAPEAEWTAPANVTAVMANLTTTQSKAFEPLLGAIKNLKADKEQQKLGQSLERTIRQLAWRDGYKAGNEADLERAIVSQAAVQRALDARMPTAKEASRAANSARMGYYQRTKNIPKYREATNLVGDDLASMTLDSLKAKDSRRYDQFMAETSAIPDSVRRSDDFQKYATMMKTAETNGVAGSLNAFAWNYFMMVDDPADLNRAIKWAERSVELIRNAPHLDAYAQLLGKVGRTDEAIVAEKATIEIAKSKGAPTANYEKTLAEFEAKKSAK